MSIYRAPEYNKHQIIQGEKMKDDRLETIERIRALLAGMTKRQLRGLKPATIERNLKKIEEQIRSAE